MTQELAKGIAANQVGNWSLHDVQSWMDEDGNKDLFGPYKEVFKNEEVDGALLLALSTENLEEIGVDCASGRKMAQKIALLTGQHFCQACLRSSGGVCERDLQEV